MVLLQRREARVHEGHMGDFSGVIPVFEVAPLLWSLPLLPLAGALLAARIARLDGEPENGTTWVAPIATWLSTLATLPLAFRLGNLNGTQKALLAPGPVLFRSGTLDLHLGLTLDGLGIGFILLLLIAASLAQLGLLLAPGSTRQHLATSALISAATAATAFALLASCPIVSVIGAASLPLLGIFSHRNRIQGFSLLGEIPLLAGAAILTWGFVGAWSSGELLPANRDRFIAILQEKGVKNTSPGTGYLTLATTPGAHVSLDNNNKIIAEAPFVRLPVPAGPHTVKIDPGHGAEIETIQSFRLSEGSEALLLRLDGASDLAGITTLTNLHQGSTPVVLRGRLSETYWWGIPISFWTALLLATGLLLKLLPPRSSSTTYPQTLWLLVPQVGGLLIASLMAVRWLPLLALASAHPTTLLLFLYTGAALLALAGFLEYQPARTLGLCASASTALGFTAAASGAPESTALHSLLIATATLLGLWQIAQIERPNTPRTLASYQGAWSKDIQGGRWIKLAYAGIIGLLPVGFGWLEILRTQGELRVLLLPSLGLLSASLGRAIYTWSEGDGPEKTLPRNTKRGESDPPPSSYSSDPLPNALAKHFVLLPGILLLTLGPLGAASIYDAPLASWFRASLTPRTSSPNSTVLTFGLWFLLTGSALLGARWARLRHGSQRASDWSEQEPNFFPQRLLSPLLAGTHFTAEFISTKVARLGAFLASPLERLRRAAGLFGTKPNLR